MMRFLVLFVLAVSVSACVPSRGDRDARLAQACENAVRALSGPQEEIFIKSKTFEHGKLADDRSSRTVQLVADSSRNKAAYRKKTYTCVFAEAAGLFGWKPEFHSLDFNGRMYGNVDGKLKGDFQELIVISDAMNKALY